jgi:hypothetical protein
MSYTDSTQIDMPLSEQERELAVEAVQAAIADPDFGADEEWVPALAALLAHVSDPEAGRALADSHYRTVLYNAVIELDQRTTEWPSEDGRADVRALMQRLGADTSYCPVCRSYALTCADASELEPCLICGEPVTSLLCPTCEDGTAPTTTQAGGRNEQGRQAP